MEKTKKKYITPRMKVYRTECQVLFEYSGYINMKDERKTYLA